MGKKKPKPTNPPTGTDNRFNNQNPDYRLPSPPWQYQPGDLDQLGENAVLQVTPDVRQNGIPITIQNRGAPRRNSSDDFDGFAYDVLVWELDEPGIGFGQGVYSYQEPVLPVGEFVVSRPERVALKPGSPIRSAVVLIADATYPTARQGSTGSDLLVGNQDSNGISAGAGNDTVSGLEDQDTLLGESGNDWINGGSGDDTLVGNAGDDTLYGEQGTGSFSQGGQGGDRLSGLEGQDILYGGADSDRLYGGLGNDLLRGGTGNDVLSGDEGADTLFGEAGDDIYVIDDSDTIVEQLNQGNDTAQVSINNYLLPNQVENLVLFREEAIVATGNELDNSITVSATSSDPDAAVNNVISALGGDDFVQTGKGNDAIDGGSGSDTLIGGDDSDSLTGGAGADRFLIGSFSPSSLNGVDQITDFRSAQGDKIYLSREDLKFSLAAGAVSAASFTIGATATTSAHRLIYRSTTGELFFDEDGSGVAAAPIKLATFVGAPALTLSDIIILDFTNNIVSNTTEIPLALSGVFGTGTANADTIFGGQDANFINAGAGNDRVDAGGGNDTLNGEAGNDLLRGGADSDTLNGGAGDDTLESGSNGTISDTLNGGLGDDLLKSDSGNSVLNGDEGNDVLIGARFGGRDTLNGGSGNDSLNGGDDSEDTLTGGLGADLFVFSRLSSTADTILDFSRSQGDKIQVFAAAFGVGSKELNLFSYNSATGDLSLRSQLFAQLGAGTLFNVQQDLLIAEEVAGVSLSGTANADRLVGGEGSDTLNGISGNDRISGFEGSDTLLGGAGNDWLDGGSQGDVVRGEAGSDTLYGEAGNDALEGGDGDDTLTGGAGADILTGGGGADFFNFYDPTAGNFELGDNSDPAVDGVDIITDFNVAQDKIGICMGQYNVDSPFRAAGLKANATLTADQFRVGATATDAGDRLIYNSATGELFFDVDGIGAEAQVKIAALSAGLALSSASLFAFNELAATSGADNLTGTPGKDAIVGGRGDDLLNGGSGNDRLNGDDNNDLLIGLEGNDRLKGGNGKDTLIGGVGGDILQGGRDRDILALEKGLGRDLILDFKNGQDRLGLAGIKFKQLKMSQRGRNTLISLGNDSLALLKGVEKDLITAADFTKITSFN